MMLGASYLFYGWWDERFLTLIIFSTVVDYIAGLKIDQVYERGGTKQQAKRWLWLSLASNLGLLGFFKYFNFFRDSILPVLETFHFTPGWVTMNIVLPVGISFYTFQSMAYTIDIYRKETKVCRNFITFSLYVSFFPQLVAGPIERSQHLIPELQNPKPVNNDMVQTGVFLILLGYFKKLAIADALWPLIAPTLAAPGDMSAVELLLTIHLFILHLYADFSGYSDIARGVARLFGIELVRNFEQPLLSWSVSEFWRRWHISLMSWFKDYVFIPLGGSRVSPAHVYFNIAAVMVISGIWHGAGWNWVLWGLLNGVYMCIERFFIMRKRAAGIPEKPPTLREHILRALWQVHLFGIGAVIFLNPDLGKMGEYFAGLATRWGGWDGREYTLLYWTLAYVAITLFMDIWQRRTGGHEFVFKMKPVWGGVVIGFIIVMIIYWSDNPGEPYFYFQF